MISCDDCQKKLVAILDNEGAKDDEALVNAHLKDCAECRAFREDIVKLRGRFACASVPSQPAAIRQQVLQSAHADSWQTKNRYAGTSPQRRSLLMRFPRLAWAGGLAALFLIAASWIVSFSLARKVETLKQQLETSRREIALAKEKEHFEEAQDRQQKAISALYFRMQELEQRVERSGPPRSAYMQAEHNGL